MAILGCLAEIAYTDLKCRKIPNKRLLRMLVLKVIFSALECAVHRSAAGAVLASAFAGFFQIGCVMIAAYLLTRRGIGAGDVKLFSVLGFCMGVQTAAEILLRAMSGASIYLVIQLFQGKLRRRQEIALAPFAFIGAVLAMIEAR